MARPPAWKHTLDEARRQALVAIDFYNRPGDRRSFFDFVVHMHLAWQNLFHAHRMKHGLEIFYRKKDGRRFERNPDNSKKTYDLKKCLSLEFDADHPIRKNLEFFIGLRNRIEHRFQDAILDYTESETHACIINFETVLVERFGLEETLSGELKFPLFVHSLTPARYEQQRALRAQLPSDVVSYITEFQKGVSDVVMSDERYAYRLLLIPMKGPKTEADAALNFVKQDELTVEERQALMGKEASVLITEKYRDVIHGDEMLPKAAADAVEKELKYHFSVNDFTRIRKLWKVGPNKSGSKTPMSRSDGYCLYSPAFKQFVYTPKFIKKIVEAVKTPNEFERLLQRRPKYKGETGSE